MAVQTQIQTRRGTAASWTSTNPTLAAGEFGYETDTGKFKIGNGSTAWASLAYTAAATAVTYLFNATSGQTTFSGADANGLTLAYTVGAEQVYLNGVLQVRGSDYTATNGTSIVLASGALTSDVLNVIAYSAMTVTDTYTQAQADAKFYQNANAFVAGKNAIINGGFDIWQRGTTFTNPGSSGAYNTDRWCSYFNGNATITQETTVKPATSTYALKITATASSLDNAIYQLVEELQMEQFRGKTVTLSAKIAGTTGIGVALNLAYSTTANDNLFNTNVSITPTVVSNPSINTSTFSTFFSTFVVPTTAKTLRIGINSGAMANTNVLYIAEVQLELGLVATTFGRSGGTIAGELAACQRYFYRLVNGTSQCVPAPLYFESTSAAVQSMGYPVVMRTAASITATASNFRIGTHSGTFTTCNSLAVFDSTPQSVTLVWGTATAPFTLGASGRVNAISSGSPTLDFSAEL